MKTAYVTIMIAFFKKDEKRRLQKILQGNIKVSTTYVLLYSKK